MTCSSTFLKYPFAVLAQTPAAYILMYCNSFSTTFRKSYEKVMEIHFQRLLEKVMRENLSQLNALVLITEPP